MTMPPNLSDMSPGASVVSSLAPEHYRDISFDISDGSEAKGRRFENFRGMVAKGFRSLTLTAPAVGLEFLTLGRGGYIVC